MRVTLRVTQRSWVQVTADGNVVVETLLEAGQDKNAEAERTLLIRTGNAAGIDLTLNDAKLGPMGGNGEVLERAWMLEDGKVYDAVVIPAVGSTPAVLVTATPRR